MKRIIFIVAMLISSTIFAFRQVTNEEQNLKRIEEELNTSLLKGDASVSEKYLADSFISTDPGGG
ncbi:MAG TPA: hypothetical protein VGB71_12010, partial [Flavisolibacter sp.]